MIVEWSKPLRGNEKDGVSLRETRSAGWGKEDSPKVKHSNGAVASCRGKDVGPFCESNVKHLFVVGDQLSLGL